MSLPLFEEHLDRLAGWAGVHLLRRGLGVDQGPTFMGVPPSIEASSTILPLCRVLQETLPTGHCEMARPLPFTPWHKILPDRVTVEIDNDNRNPEDINQHFRSQQWALVCDGSVRGEGHEGAWVFSFHHKGKEVWRDSGGIRNCQVSTDAEMAAIHEALQYV